MFLSAMDVDAVLLDAAISTSPERQLEAWSTESHTQSNAVGKYRRANYALNLDYRHERSITKSPVPGWDMRGCWWIVS